MHSNYNTPYERTHSREKVRGAQEWRGGGGGGRGGGGREGGGGEGGERRRKGWMGEEG